MAQQLKSNQSRLQHQSLLQSQSQAQQQQPCSVSLKINQLFRLEWHVMSLDCGAATANRFKLLRKMLRMSWLWECKNIRVHDRFSVSNFQLAQKQKRAKRARILYSGSGQVIKASRTKILFSQSPTLSPLPFYVGVQFFRDFIGAYNEQKYEKIECCKQSMAGFQPTTSQILVGRSNHWAADRLMF